MLEEGTVSKVEGLGAHKPSPEGKPNYTGGRSSGCEKTRSAGLTGAPEAHEVTFAPKIYPLRTSGTGLVGQQTSERPLCARAYCMVRLSQTLPLSSCTAQLWSPLKRSMPVQVQPSTPPPALRPQEASSAEGHLGEPQSWAVSAGVSEPSSRPRNRLPPRSSLLGPPQPGSFIKGRRRLRFSPAAAPLAPRQGPAPGGDEEAH